MPSQIGLSVPHTSMTPMKSEEDVFQGWVLKKRRKKMQGYARRYFVLKHDGVLIYSTQPGSSPRDSIPLRLATVTSSERAHQITVDSGTKTFHIRCFSPADFEKWMSALKTFQSTDDNGGDLASLQQPGAGIPTPSFSDRFLAVVRDMDVSIQELERLLVDSAQAFEDHDSHSGSISKKRSLAQLRSRKEKEEKDNDQRGKGEHSIFGIFHRKTSNNSAHGESSPSDNSPASTPSISSIPSVFPPSLQSSVTPSPSNTSINNAFRQLQALRTQHTALLSMLENLPHLIPSSPASISHLTTHLEARGSEEGDAPPTPRVSGPERMITSPLSAGHGHGAISPAGLRSPRSMRSRSSFVPHLRPMSLHTVGSSGDSIFFDAEDGGLEFVDMDRTMTSTQSDSDEDPCEDEARIAAQAIASATISGEYSEIDGEQDGTKTPVKSRHLELSLDMSEVPKSGSMISQVSSSSTVSIRLPSTELQTPVRRTAVVRRTRLPAPTSGEQLSLFTMLKRNIGKDLSTVAFPVTFNEPLSLLQHAAEDLEYLDVLEKAVAGTDPVERMAFVAAFAVSGYACTKLRASRKPFNPLLGETFEDPRYNFVSEKVSHHPPVIACHAHGDGWEFWSTSSAKNKFWGKSLEIIPIGTTYLKIGDETYSWQKPSSFMRNLIAGEKYLEHCGFMTINTLSSSLQCTLEFKEGGFWGTNKDEVFGKIVSPDNMTDVELRGRWNSSMSRLLDASGSHLHVLWRATSLPEDAMDYYGFTQFAISLNEITDDIRDFIPPTDSRLRPDQRALEDGDVDRAEAEKARVEEAQRERRARRAESGEEWQPRWFRQKPGAPNEWEYAGGYWEARKKRAWTGLEQMW